jgi:hypothetical protein
MPKKPSLKSLKDIDVASKLSQNLSWLFFAIFLLLVLFEIFEVNNSVQMVFQAGKSTPAVAVEKGVDIDFTDYNLAVQRINTAQTYKPDGGITVDPFNPGTVIQPVSIQALPTQSTSSPSH